MENKRCDCCHVNRPIEEYSYRNRLLQLRHSTCKECQKRFKRAYYERNLDSYKKQSAQQKYDAIRRHRERIRDYLLAHPCVDCGESDPIVLQFDHVSQKSRGISLLVLDGVSWEKISREIAKCEVRCANCHRKKTAGEQGWYKKLGL